MATTSSGHHESLAVHVPETATKGHLVGSPLRPLLSGNPGNPTQVLFTLVDNKGGIFGVERHTGQLYIAQPALDFEAISQFHLEVFAQRTSHSNWRHSFDVTCFIEDVIDEIPSFAKEVYSFNIPRLTSPNSRIARFEINDEDSHDSHVITAALSEPIQSSDIAPFHFEASAQSLYLRDQLTSTPAEFKLLLTVSDSAGLSSTCEVNVIVSDAIEERIVATVYQKVSVEENTIPEHALATLSHLQGSCAVLDSPVSSYFHFDISLNLWLVAGLDYEQYHSVNATITCHSIEDSNTILSIQHFEIEITNLNDNHPVFPIVQTLSFDLPENVEPRSVRLPIPLAYDADNEDVTVYYFDPPSDDFQVTFDANFESYFITTTRFLDYEKTPSFSLALWAEDQDGLISEHPLLVIVNVLNQNDNYPAFNKDKYTADVVESSQGLLLQVSAFDEDSAPRVLTYEFHSPYKAFDCLKLDGVSGELVLTCPLDFEANLRAYVGYFIARDSDNIPSQPAMFELNLCNMEGERESATRESISHSVQFELPENAPEGTFIGRVECLQCNFQGIATIGAPFTLDRETGDIYTSDEMDYESDPLQYNFTVSAWDSSQHEVAISVMVNLLDMNEHCPYILEPKAGHTIRFGFDTPPGTEIATLLATDDDLGMEYGRVVDYIIVNPLVMGQEPPFEVITTDLPTARLVITTQFFSEQLWDYHHVDVIAVDGGSFTSKPIRITINTIGVHLNPFLLSPQLTEFDSPHKHRLIRQAPSVIDVSQIELVLSYQQNSVEFGPSSGPSQFFTQSYPEDFTAGEFLVTLSLIHEGVTLEPPSSCTPEVLLSPAFVVMELDVPFAVERDNQTCQSFLVNKETLDYEVITFAYVLSIQAMYSGELVPTVAYAQLYLSDVNEHPPRFVEEQISVTFNENFIGVIFRPEIIDNDGSFLYGNLTELTLTGDSRFEVTLDGVVRNLVAFDYEQEDACYYFNLTATDYGGLQDMATVEACLVDADDNCPRFEENEYAFTVEENNDVDVGLFNLTALDHDASSEHSSTVVYSLQPESISELFTIDSNTGEIFIRKVLDFETDPEVVTFQAVATDASGNTCTANITVTLLNLNDQPPVFNDDIAQVLVSEEIHPVQISDLPENVLVCASATDPDGGNVTYSLTEPSDYFQVSPLSGCLVLLQPLDYESQARHILEITASDGGNLTAERPFLVYVEVTNENDLEVKVQSEYTVDILESYYTSASIYNLTVRNPTPGLTYSFALETDDEYFAVTRSGRVHVMTQLDYETQRTHIFTVTISDGTQFTISRVIVNILPVNEYPPEFIGARGAEVEMSEGSSAGVFQYVFSAVDPDEDSIERIIYNISVLEVEGVASANLSDFDIPFFIIQPELGENDGILTNTRAINFETDPRVYIMEIYASDGSFISLQPFTVTVLVQDINDFAPQFEYSAYNFTVSEDEGDVQLQVEASDADGSIAFGSVVLYAIDSLDGNPVPFYSAGNGRIRNTQRFDYETLPNVFQFRFIAFDDFGLSGTTIVTVFIEDANDFRPYFFSSVYQATIPENTTIGEEIVTVMAEDRDTGAIFGSLTYSLQGAGTSLSDLPFSINETTGVVTLTAEVDFDIGQEGEDFFVVATDGGGLMSETRVYVSFEDVNDNAPCPLLFTLTVQVVENMAQQGVPLGRIQTYDDDYYVENPPAVFYMEPNFEEFNIDETSSLYVVGQLDFEVKEEYNFIVISSDGIRNCTKANTSVRIMVIDIDDNRPQFESLTYEFDLYETMAPGGLFSILATDADSRDRVSEYYIDTHHTEDFIVFYIFTISSSGLVSNIVSFDADNPTQQLSYTFLAIAYNQFGQSTSELAQITINILDQNDNSPVFSSPQYAVSINENHPLNSVPVLVVRATDADRTPAFSSITYSLLQASPYFEVNSQNGSITLTSELDYEVVSSTNYTLVVIASDGELESTTTVRITLQNVNEFPPVFPQPSYELSIPLDVQINSIVHTFLASDADISGQFGIITRYDLIRDNSSIQGTFPFQLDPNGTLYTIVNATDFMQNVYTFQVIAFDGGNLTSQLVAVHISFEDIDLSNFQTEHCLRIPENSIPPQPLVDLADFQTRGHELYSYRVADKDIGTLMLQDTAVFLLQELNFEAQALYIGHVIASNRLGTEIPISISICLENLNDNPTEFTSTVESLVLTDESVLGPQLSLQLTDRDSNLENTPVEVSSNHSCCENNGSIQTEISFIFSSQSVPFSLDFDETTGIATLSSTVPVSQMSSCNYSFEVAIMDADNLSSSSSLSVEVQLLLQPEGAPVFGRTSYSFSFAENSYTGFEVSVGHVEELNACLDPALSRFQLSIEGSGVDGLFVIGSDGIISNVQTVDYETSPESLNFSVQAINYIGVSSVVLVSISVQDTNEFCPQITSTIQIPLSEEASIGELVMEEYAVDGDGSMLYGRIFYTLRPPSGVSVPFALHANGSLYVADTLDYDYGQSEFLFEIEITDDSASVGNLMGVSCNHATASVNITLVDENDEAPFYLRLQYSFAILEDARMGAIVGQLQFDDPDEVSHTATTFVLNPMDVPFQVDSQGRIVLATASLDFETQQRFTFTARIFDGRQSSSQAANVTVNVMNVNEFPPSFDQEFSVFLEENATPLVGIVTVTTSDRDAGLFGEVLRYVLTGPQSSYFEIDADGVIRNRQEFDFEVDETEFNFMVTAYDGGEMNSTTLVTITLLDVNDNTPAFEQETYSANVSEAATLSEVFLLSVRATDDDLSPELNTVTYTLPAQPCSNLFSVDFFLGALSIVTPVDFEVGPTECQLTVNAHDPAGLTSSAVVEVTFLDTNEHRPVIESVNGELNLTVHEALEIGDLAYEFQASDRDGGVLFSSIVEFQLIPISVDFPFSINDRGQLLVLRGLERFDTHECEVLAIDGGGLESERVYVSIAISKANLFPPEMSSANFSYTLEENMIPSYPLLSLEATDEDDDVVTFLVMEGPLGFLRFQALPDNHANVWLQQSLDFEVASVYHFRISAFDGFHFSTSVTLTIHVTPVNEFRPVFMEVDSPFELPENAPAFSYNIPIRAFDSDRDTIFEANGTRTTHGIISQFYLVTGSSSLFTLVNQTADGSVTLTNQAVLDYEEIYFDPNVTIQAVDGSGLVASEPLTIIIYVTDENDNAPYFRRELYTSEIAENFAGNSFENLFARDRDSSYLNSHLTYSIVALPEEESESEVPFEIHPVGTFNSFNIALVRPLDYETDPNFFQFLVVAEDYGGQNASTTIEVVLLDMNEFAPTFDTDNISISIPESHTPNSLIYTFNATDRDGSEQLGTVMSYTAIDLPSVFTLDSTSGELHLGSLALDFETQGRQYQFEVVATDGGGLSSSSLVILDVTNVNEFPPEFTSMAFNVTITENTLSQLQGGPLNSLLQLTVTDGDAMSSQPDFELLDTNGSQLFSIDANGYLILSSPLDYEEQSLYVLRVLAREGNLTSTSPAFVTVRVLNTNDNPPMFEEVEYTVCIAENIAPISPLLSLNVRDHDGSLNTLNFQITPNLSSIEIDSSGNVFVIYPFDYETTQSIEFSIALSDGLFHSSTNASVTILVVGENDNLPVFGNSIVEFRFSVSESNNAGTRIDFDNPIFVVDLDLPNQHFDRCAEIMGEQDPSPNPSNDFSYRVLERNSPFGVQTDSDGVLYLEMLRPLDYETERHEYTVTIVASDGTFDTPSPTTSLITLLNEDDSVPEFDQPSYEWRLPENSDTFTASVEARDPDRLGGILYSIEPLQPNLTAPSFEINQDNGSIFSGGPFDFEQFPNGFNFTIEARDSGGHISVVTASLILVDVNDHSPVIEETVYEASIPESLSVGDTALTVHATDGDGSEVYGTIVEFTVLGLSLSQERSFPFTINPDGSVVVSGELDYEEGQRLYEFQVRASDGGNRTSVAVPVTITILDVPDTPSCPTEPVYEASVFEGRLTSTPLAYVQVTFSANVSELTFILTPQRPEVGVTTDGRILLLQELDYELEKVVTFNLTIFNGILTCETPSQVIVTINNVNDNPSEFVARNFEISIFENSPQTDLITLNTTDRDGEPHDVVILYEITPGNMPFRITGGVLQNTITLDAEAISTFAFQVVAVGSSGLRSQPATVTVTVQDENEFLPEFSEVVYEKRIVEGAESGTSVLTVAATDRDVSEIFGSVQFEITTTDVPFAVNSTTGVVSLTETADFEISEEYNFLVRAMDGAGLNSTASVRITLRNINEHPPEFTVDPIIIYVQEDTDLGVVVYSLRSNVTDADSGGVYGTVTDFTENVIDNSTILPFVLQANGDIVTSGYVLDYENDEEPKTFTISVQAHDGGGLSSNPVNVTVVVLNINDVPATLNTSLIVLTVPEDTEIGYEIVDFVEFVIDPEDGISPIFFFFRFTEDAILLDLYGTLTVNRTLDYEEVSEYRFNLIIYDGRYFAPAYTTVVVEIENVNDNMPYFPLLFYNATLSENAPPGTLNLIIQARDDDSLGYSDPNSVPDFARIASYHFAIAPLQGNLFNITTDSESGEARITNAAALDFETQCVYRLFVSAVDGGLLTSIMPAEIEITILDVNEHPASFEQNPYVFEVLENTQIRQQIVISDRDENALCRNTIGGVLFSLIGDDASYFSIDGQGVLRNETVIDYEDNSTSYSFEVVVQDGPFSSTTVVLINVADQNDFSPVFLQDYAISVDESAQIGTVVLTIEAYDGDGSSVYGSIVQYFVVASDQVPLPFFLSPTGALELVIPLDYEGTFQSYHFFVTAEDGGGRQAETPAEITIFVNNINDLPPSFLVTDYFFVVREEHFEDDDFTILYVGQLDVEDLDQLTLTFTITETGLPFTINSSGAIFMTQPPDFEQVQIFSFSVSVSDGIFMAQEQATATVIVENINEHAPIFNSSVEVFIPENTIQNQGWLQLRAMDDDEGQYGTIAYTLVGAPFFTVDPNGHVTNLRMFDYEAGDRVYVFTAIAEDIGGLEAETTVTVIVNDVNEFAPRLEVGSYNVSTSENFAGTVLTVRAQDDDGSAEYGSVSYSFQDSSTLFSINPETGKVSTATSLDYESTGPGPFELVVTARDGGGLESRVSVSIHLLDVNEFDPVLTEDSYSHCVSESTPLSSVILTFQARDDDGSQLYGDIASYRMLLPLIGVTPPFEIDSSGNLLISDSLESRAGRTFDFQVVALDGAGRSSQPIPVTVCILDINNNPPHFLQLSYSVMVVEGTHFLDSLVELQAADTDNNETDAGITFSVVTHSDLFYVDLDGNLRLLAALDFEQHEELVVTIAAFDGIFHSSANASVHVTVQPINEHKPRFSASSYTAEIAENSPPRVLRLELTVSDADNNPPAHLLSDLGHHGDVISVNVTSGDTAPFEVTFDEVSETVIITNLRSFDSENGDTEFAFTMVAEDGASLHSDPVEVVITILDTNDEVPIFDQALYTFQLPENTEGNLFSVSATDSDASSQFNQVEYYLTGPAIVGLPITVHDTGVIEILQEFDFENGPTDIFTFSVIATDNGGLSGNATISITVTDQNEFAPVFLGLPPLLDIDENTPIGTELLTVVVSDGDGGSFGVSGPPTISELPSFLEFTSDGVVKIAEELDYEVIVETVYNVTFEACDGGNSCAVHLLEVTIFDVNEHPPEFAFEEHTIYVEENVAVELQSQANTPQHALFRLSVTDGDIFAHNSFTFNILSASPQSNAFAVESRENDGFLLLLRPLDHEAFSSYELIIEASDGTFVTAVPATVIIEVVNVNDNPPVIHSVPIPIQVFENDDEHLMIFAYIVSDDDGDLTPITLHFSNGSNDDGTFELDENRQLHIVRALDYETTQSLSVSVYASDGEFDSTPLVIIVDIVGVNDNSPEFQQVSISANLSENAAAGSLQVRVMAEDDDLPHSSDGFLVGEAVQYEINAPEGASTSDIPFSVSFDPLTGEGVITNDISFDFESMAQMYTFYVTALDGEGLESEVPLQVRIEITDRNDVPPQFDRVFYSTSLSENSVDFALTVSATDGDGSEAFSSVTYSILDTEFGQNFAIDAESGQVTVLSSYDYETGVRTVQFMVIAEDTGGLSDIATVSVEIEDINDNSPQFDQATYSAEVSEDTDVSFVVLRVEALDDDHSTEYGSITSYTIRNDSEQDLPFQIDLLFGQISVATSLDFETEPTEYSFTVVATDDGGLTGETEVAITVLNVNDNPACPLEMFLNTSVLENAVPDLPLLTVEAVDIDNISQVSINNVLL